MTDKQFLILSSAMDILRGVAAVQYVGYYPDDVYNIGQQYPACILRDGDEGEVLLMTGNTLLYNYAFDIVLHHELTQSLRIKDVLTVQNAILTALYSQLDGLTACTAIVNHSIAKGDVQDAVIGAGYQNEITSRVITINMTVKDTRS